MICPNCQMVQPQENLAYCVRCNYPFQNRMQGFFTKSSQTGYSQADAYSAARRGQPMPQQQYPQVPYPQQAQQQNANPVQVMYDANGNQVYVQLMYDRAGRPVYVQMMPKVVGKDASGNPVCTMVPIGQIPVPQQMQPSASQQTYAQQAQPSPSPQTYSQYAQPSPSPQTYSQYAQQITPSPPQQAYTQQIPPQNHAYSSSSGNAQFIPRTDAKPPPVPVLPRPGEQPEQTSVPDRPAMRASSIASSMYTAAQQNQNAPGTGSFFARMQQQKQQQYSGYAGPISAEELLQEAQTAFVQQPADADANTVLNRIFETQPKEYQMNAGRDFAVNVSSGDVASVSERNLYKSSESTLPQVPRNPESRSEPESVTEPEEKEKKSEGLKLFRKKNKEKPKTKTVIVDADEIFGDSKRHQVEMLGITIDGDDRAVNAKLREMKNGGRRSVRSMKDAEVTVESMIDDPQAGSFARRALTDEVVQQAYDSAESAEIAKALEQLNQGIFPKSFK